MALVVVSFDTPTGTLIPSTQLDGMFVANFNVMAEFAGTDGDCGAGVYRQYVRGEFRVETKRITKLVCVGRELTPNAFQEDGCPYPGPPPNADPSIIGAYGYRANGSSNNPHRPDEQYTPSPENGCNFWMADSPGLMLAAPPPPRQLTYTVDLTFRGDLIDTLTGQTLQSKTWQVAGQITVSAGSAGTRRAVGLHKNDRIIGVTARRDPASGTLDVYIDIARMQGERSPLDVTALGLALKDDHGRTIHAGEPLAAELVGRAGSRATFIYPLQRSANTPSIAEITINSVTSVHKVAARDAS